MVSSRLAISKEVHYSGEPYPLEIAEHIPHLHGVATAIRNQLHAQSTLRDVDTQNKLLFEMIMYRLNTDLLFRYAVTGEYSLYLRLFTDPEEIARTNQIVYELNARDTMNLPPLDVIHPVVVKVNDASVSNYSNWQDTQPMFYWTHPAPTLSNCDKLQHYQRELERIDLNYHGEIFRIRNAAIQSEVQYMNNMLAVYKQDPIRYKNEIAKIESFHDYIERNNQQIAAINPFRADGSKDMVSEKIQAQEIEKFQNEIIKFVDTLPVVDQNVKALQLERLQGRHKAEEMIIAVNKNHHTAKGQLSAHIHQAKINLKLEILQAGGKVIDKIRTHGVGDDQKMILSTLLPSYAATRVK